MDIETITVLVLFLMYREILRDCPADDLYPGNKVLPHVAAMALTVMNVVVLKSVVVAIVYIGSVLRHG